MDCLGVAGLRDCRNDQTAPKGAALTYARRYSLFRLVGIAGEDDLDLDAPDVIGPAPQTEMVSIESKSASNGGQPTSTNRRAGRTETNKFNSPSAKSELSVALSASLRAELLREIEGLSAADNAALWAQRRLPAKNQLSATDAQQVEEAFAAKLATISAENPKRDDADSDAADLGLPGDSGIPQIDKSVLVFPEPRRIRDREHVRHVDEATVPIVRSAAVRSSSSALCPMACARPQGQRRIYGATLSHASSRGSSLRK